MTRRTPITSTTNDRLKALRRLARRRDRGVFLVEGHRQLRRALDAGVGVSEVYACPELFLGPADPELVRRAEQAGARVTDVAPQAFRTLATAARPDGLLAVVERWSTTLAAVGPDTWSLVLVAQGIERPGNLGAIVRSACSAGASALLACEVSVDVFHPEVVRGSVGTLFSLPVARCTSAAAIAWLRERDVRIVVAAPNGDRLLWDLDLTGPLGLVVGSERRGVDPLWRVSADATAAIPMPGPSDSLNVAVAAGVALFEAVRQRSGS